MATVNEEHNSNPVRYDPTFSEWGYWDETWTFWTGGFDSEEAARKALREYCMAVLGWGDDEA
jgi:hypothetical protein